MTQLTKRIKYRKAGYQSRGSSLIHTGGNAMQRAINSAKRRTPLDTKNRPDLGRLASLNGWLRGRRKRIVSTPNMVFER